MKQENKSTIYCVNHALVVAKTNVQNAQIQIDAYNRMYRLLFRELENSKIGNEECEVLKREMSKYMNKIIARRKRMKYWYKKQKKLEAAIEEINDVFVRCESCNI
jgi:hypothetical protein